MPEDGVSLPFFFAHLFVFFYFSSRRATLPTTRCSLACSRIVPTCCVFCADEGPTASLEGLSRSSSHDSVGVVRGEVLPPKPPQVPPPRPPPRGSTPPVAGSRPRLSPRSTPPPHAQERRTPPPHAQERQQQPPAEQQLQQQLQQPQQRLPHDSSRRFHHRHPGPTSFASPPAVKQEQSPPLGPSRSIFSTSRNRPPSDMSSIFSSSGERGSRGISGDSESRSKESEGRSESRSKDSSAAAVAATAVASPLAMQSESSGEGSVRRRRRGGFGVGLIRQTSESASSRDTSPNVSAELPNAASAKSERLPDVAPSGASLHTFIERENQIGTALGAGTPMTSRTEKPPASPGGVLRAMAPMAEMVGVDMQLLSPGDSSLANEARELVPSPVSGLSVSIPVMPPKESVGDNRGVGKRLSYGGGDEGSSATNAEQASPVSPLSSPSPSPEPSSRWDTIASPMSTSVTPELLAATSMDSSKSEPADDKPSTKKARPPALARDEGGSGPDVPSSPGSKMRLLQQIQELEEDISKTEGNVERAEKQLERERKELANRRKRRQKANKAAAEARRKAEAAADTGGEKNIKSKASDKRIEQEAKHDVELAHQRRRSNSLSLPPPQKKVYTSLLEQMISENRERGSRARSELAVLCPPQLLCYGLSGVPPKEEEAAKEEPKEKSGRPIVAIANAKINREQEASKGASSLKETPAAMDIDEGAAKEGTNVNGDGEEDSEDLTTLAELRPKQPKLESFPNVIPPEQAFGEEAMEFWRPVYRSPDEAESHKANLRRFPLQRPHMTDVLTARKIVDTAHHRRLAVRYARLGQRWAKTLLSRHNRQKSIRCRQKDREAERKDAAGEPPSSPSPSGRETRPIVQRTPARNLDSVRSEAEFDELMETLQAAERKKLRYEQEAATLPDQIVVGRERRARFFDNRNGLIEDAKEHERQRKLINPWTPREKAVFEKKYLKHPKNFRKIATYLPNKSVNECVHYFYASKMTVNYKAMLKASLKGNKRKPGSTSTAEAVAAGLSASNSAGGKPSIVAPRKRYNGIPRELIGLALDVSAYDGTAFQDKDGNVPLPKVTGVRRTRAGAEKDSTNKESDEETEEEPNEDDSSKKQSGRGHKRHAGGDDEEEQGEDDEAQQKKKKSRRARDDDEEPAGEDDEGQKPKKKPRRARSPRSAPAQTPGGRSTRRRGGGGDVVFSMEQQIVFVESYERFGKDWEAVARSVGRSPEECESYFNANKEQAREASKQARQEGGSSRKRSRDANDTKRDSRAEPTSSRKRSRKETDEEPVKVEKEEPKVESKPRSSRPVQKRPHTQPWSVRERQRMVSAVKANGRVWTIMCEAVPTRTLGQIKKFYHDNKYKLGLEERPDDEESPPPTEKDIKASRMEKRRKLAAQLAAAAAKEGEIEHAAAAKQSRRESKGKNAAEEDKKEGDYAADALNSLASFAEQAPAASDASAAALQSLMPGQGYDMQMQQLLQMQQLQNDPNLMQQLALQQAMLQQAMQAQAMQQAAMWQQQLSQQQLSSTAAMTMPFLPIGLPIPTYPIVSPELTPHQASPAPGGPGAAVAAPAALEAAAPAAAPAAAGAADAKTPAVTPIALAATASTDSTTPAAETPATAATAAVSAPATAPAKESE